LEPPNLQDLLPQPTNVLDLWRIKEKALIYILIEAI
jgi:hypothetical protein